MLSQLHIVIDNRLEHHCATGQLTIRVHRRPWWQRKALYDSNAVTESQLL